MSQEIQPLISMFCFHKNSNVGVDSLWILSYFVMEILVKLIVDVFLFVKK